MQSDQEVTDNLFVDSTLIVPEDPTDQEYLVKQRYEQFANAINNREIALYDTVEFETGQDWYNPKDAQAYRSGYRKVVLTGAITGHTVIPHGITNLVQVTQAWGIGNAGSPVVFFPLVFAGQAGTDNVSFKIDLTNVIFDLGGTATALDDSFVVIEYLKE